MKIAKPNVEDYPPFFGTYIDKISSDDLLITLEQNGASFHKFIEGLSEEKMNYRYAPDKWTVKEMLLHITDTERIMCYRALRFARKDSTHLSSFEENDFAANSFGAQRSTASLLSEFDVVRKATLELFKNFDESVLDFKGTANNKMISVRALGYTIAGHEMHHLSVINERYL